MKRFFGKRRATRSALGELNTQPFGRLGALVFQLNNSDRLYWASLWAPTRIAGCALSLEALTITRWENVSSEKSRSTGWEALTENQELRFKQFSGARLYGYDRGPQGIARHAPPCPAALHLDRLGLRQKCAAKELLVKNCFQEKMNWI